MTGDIVTRLRTWVHAVDAARASDLMDEAAAEIERLRDRCNELIDAARKYVAENEPIRMDMNDPLFDEGAYE